MNNYKDFIYDFVSNIIESSGSIVHEDVRKQEIPGLSFIIEIIVDAIPINKTTGVYVISYGENYSENENFTLDISNFIDYYKRNNLSILFILVDKTKKAFWNFFEYPYFVDNIKFDKERVFDLSTFNLDVVPNILQNKPLLSNIKKTLKEDESEIFMDFLRNIFNYTDLAIPFIIQNEEFEDFLKDTGLIFNIHNLCFSTAQYQIESINKAVKIVARNELMWWAITNNICNISFNAYIHLKSTYLEIRK